ncbi:MAG: ABC transporter permease [Melioribacteraceae bacterium]|nr:ABC transporter permease [Melioribacteraceae bacterium]
MFNFRVLAVVKRELMEKLFSKAFITMTLLVPGLIFLMLGIQALLYSSEKKNLRIDIITESDNLTSAFRNDFLESEYSKNGKYIFSFQTMNKEELKKYLEGKKKDLIDEKLGGIIFIPSTAMKDKKVEYYAKSSQNISLFKDLDGLINKTLIDQYFNNKTLSKEELDFARLGVDFTGFKVSEEEGIKEEGYGNLVLAYLFTFLLYISLLMIGQMTMQSVIEEKGNRIVEVILSSVSPTELMTGKILGATLTGIIQMAIWLSPVILLMSTTIFVLPKELLFSINGGVIVYMLINFFIGLLTFIGLFAMLGAIFDNPQDASSGTMPVMMLIIIPFFIALSMMENPNRPVAEIASLFPFASIIVMPARMTLVGVPFWHLLLAVVINILTFVAIFPIAGKIYRVGILRTGKKPKWGEVIKWLKYKY